MFQTDQIIRWGIEIASAVDHIHQNNIVHRDLKPGNIFLDQNTCAKIGDFGIAKIMKNNEESITGLQGVYIYYKYAYI